MTIIAYITVSLDGYIADEYGNVDWLNDIPNPDQSDYRPNEVLHSDAQ